MKKNICLILIFASLSFQQLWAQRRMKQMDADKQAQEDDAKSYEKKSFTDRLVYGGNFWLSFGNVYSQVYIQPLVGYKVTDKFIAGGGVTYIYWKQKYVFTNNTTAEYSDNIYGLNLFARHDLFGPIFAQAEYQPMNFTRYTYTDQKRVWANAFYLGGGFNQSFGKSGTGAYILVLYDVLWKADQSLRLSPVDIRFGLFF